MPHNDGSTSGTLLPVNVHLVDEITGEPGAFVTVSANDTRMVTQIATSDGTGRLRFSEPMATGELFAYIVRGAHGIQSFTGGSPLARPGRHGSAELPHLPHRGEPDDPDVWRLPLQRVMPVTLVVPEGYGGTTRLWFGERGSEQVEARHIASVERFYEGVVGDFAGATHVVELHEWVEDLQGVLWMEVWRHATAADLRATRQLHAVIVHSGELWSAAASVARIPRIGEAPISLELQPTSLKSLPTEMLRAVYSSKLDEHLAERGEARDPEPGFDYKVSGVVRSNTGTHRGEVHVRASPAERNTIGASTLRHQWITVEWTKDSKGEWTAPFELDRLDATIYRIVVLSGEGKELDGAPVEVDAIEPPASLVFTVLD
ncbi:hypothetical protein [Saltatorellus ferox]